MSLPEAASLQPSVLGTTRGAYHRYPELARNWQRGALVRKGTVIHFAPERSSDTGFDSADQDYSPLVGKGISTGPAVDRKHGAVTQERSVPHGHSAHIIALPFGPYPRHPPRSLRSHRQHRRRRHGRGLSRARHEAGSRRRDQDPARGVRARCRSARALPARSARRSRR